MTDEKYIEEKVGNRNPFQVPEGYFDHFAEQMMQQLPEGQAVQTKPRAKSIWLRPVYYVAASVCALFISGAVWMSMSKEEASSTPAQAQLVQQEEQEQYLEEAADYMMLDNHEIYTYLADN